MAWLLIVHHTPSPHCHEMFEAVVAGATDPDIEGVEVVRRPALTVSPVEIPEADGYVLGTPANLGNISGAMKPYLRNNSLTKTNGRLVALSETMLEVRDGLRVRYGVGFTRVRNSPSACWWR